MSSPSFRASIVDAFTCTGSPESVERARVGGGAVTVLDGTVFLEES